MTWILVVTLLSLNGRVVAGFDLPPTDLTTCTQQAINITSGTGWVKGVRLNWYGSRIHSKDPLEIYAKCIQHKEPK